MSRRLIAFLLILSICLINQVSYANDKEQTLSKSIEILEETGVYKRMGTDIQSEDTLISRLDFVSMCVNLVCPDIYLDANMTNPFSDIDITDEKGKDVLAAYSLGWISGNSNKEFSPDKYITYAQAMKIFVTILGYESEAEANGGYPMGYYSVASNLKINNSSVKSDEAVDFGTFSDILLDVLETEMCKYTVIIEDEERYFSVNYDDAETLWYRTMRIKKDKGVLRANGYTSLTSSEGAGKNQVIIGDFVGNAVLGVLTEAYLGYEVEYFYSVEKDMNYVLHMIPTKRNDIITVFSDDIESFVNRELTYYKNDRSERIRIPKSVCVIYNGKMVKKFSNEYYENKDAELKFIDNNGDGDTDVINIVAWDNIYVYAINYDNDTVIDKYSSSSSVTFEFNEDWVLWDETYREITLDDVKKGDIITVIKSEDGEYLRAIISKDTVTGKITGISSDNENTIWIDNVEYTLSSSFNNKYGIKLKLAQPVTAKLDYCGRIAGIDGGESEFEYAYIIKARIDDDSEKLLVKFMNSSGLIEKLYCADKIKFDGRTKDSISYEVTDALSVSQIAKIKINDEEIKSIDTSHDSSEKENSLRALTELQKLMYFKESKVFVGGTKGDAYDSNKMHYAHTFMGENTKLFVVPEPGSNLETNDRAYGVFGSDYFTSTTQTIQMQAFTSVAESFVPEVILVVNSSSPNITSGKNASVIKEISTVLNQDDEVTEQITVLTNGMSAVDEKVYELAEDVELSGSTLVPGDFVQFTTNSIGKIDKINRIYSYETGEYDSENTATPDIYYGNNFIPFVGYVYSREGNVFQYTKVNPSQAGENDTYYIPTETSTKVIVVKNARGRAIAEAGTYDDIHDYKHYGTGDRTLFTVAQGHTRLIVVYK